MSGRGRHGGVGISECEGVSVPIAFILFASSALIFIASLHLYKDAFVDFPSDVAIQQQFNDLGNALSTELASAILTLPHKASVEFEETLPQEIGLHQYRIHMDASSDQIQIYSFKGIVFNYTLSGMSAETNASVSLTAYGGVSKVKITLRRGRGGGS
ncbi:MAG: hypothetical protein OCU24_04865 [Candidatus Methanospirare jalkutatii]|nr:hypothetical protein [Candidatus Methanospirare jalkutatii]